MTVRTDPDSRRGRLARVAGADAAPIARITASGWWATVLLIAGARPAPIFSTDAMTVTHAPGSASATPAAGEAEAASPVETTQAILVRARILRATGQFSDARELLNEAIERCNALAATGDDRAWEPLGDLYIESGLTFRALARAETVKAIAMYEKAAAAGNDDALQRAIDLILTDDLLEAVPGVEQRAGGRAGLNAALRQLPPRERQVLAIAGLRPNPDLPYVSTVTRLNPAATMLYQQRGLDLLEPLLPAATDQLTVRELISRAAPYDPASLSIDDLNIGASVRTGGFDPDFADSETLPGQVIGGTLTDDERAMIQMMDPKDRARFLLQKRIQEKAEMAVLLSQLQSLRHQTAMSVINNIR